MRLTVRQHIGPWVAGQTIDLPERRALGLIQTGYAVLESAVLTPDAEQAITPPTEQAAVKVSQASGGRPGRSREVRG